MPAEMSTVTLTPPTISISVTVPTDGTSGVQPLPSRTQFKSNVMVLACTGLEPRKNIPSTPRQQKIDFAECRSTETSGRTQDGGERQRPLLSQLPSPNQQSRNAERSPQ